MISIDLNGKKIIKGSNDCYIIAELGTNYYEIAKQSCIPLLSAAKKLLLEAKVAGADAVKFQIFSANKIVAKNNKDYAYFEKYGQMNTMEYFELINFCEENNIQFIASLFDEEVVNIFGSRLKIFKIASPDITFKSMIEKIAQYNKPILLSTGASTRYEICRAIDWIVSKGNSKIVLLHCISEYPAKIEHINLKTIESLYKKFPYVIGYSDHSMFDCNILYSSYLFGANIIEKHFTLYKNINKDDHIHSMTPNDLVKLKKHFETYKNMIGRDIRDYFYLPEDPVRKNGRRSLFFKRDMEKGERVSKDDFICLRPGTGISPIYCSFFNGRKLIHDVKKDTMISTFDMKK